MSRPDKNSAHIGFLDASYVSNVDGFAQSARANRPKISTGQVAKNPFAEFFGVPEGAENLDLTGAIARDTLTLPEVYKGESKYLGLVVSDMMLDPANVNDYPILARFLIIVREGEGEESLHRHWKRLHADSGMLEPLPPFGTPRLMQARTEVHESHSIDLGRAWTIEHGFWRTKDGQQRYVLNLMNLTVMALRAFEAYGHARLLAGHDYKAHLRQILGSSERVTFEQAVEDEDRFFAGLIKYEDPKIVFDMYRDVLKRQKYTATICLLPPHTKLWMASYVDANRKYYENGPDAQVLKQQSAAYFDTINGMEIVEEADDIRLDGERHVNVGQSIRAIEKGGHIRLSRFFNPIGDARYKSTHRTTQIFNMDTAKGDMTTVGLEECLHNCERFSLFNRGMPLDPSHQVLADLLNENKLERRYQMQPSVSRSGDGKLFADALLWYNANPSQTGLWRKKWYTCHHLGDIEEEYYPAEELEFFATTFEQNIIQKSNLCAPDVEALCDGLDLMDELSKPPVGSRDEVRLVQLWFLSLALANKIDEEVFIYKKHPEGGFLVIPTPVYTISSDSPATVVVEGTTDAAVREAFAAALDKTPELTDNDKVRVLVSKPYGFGNVVGLRRLARDAQWVKRWEASGAIPKGYAQDIQRRALSFTQALEKLYTASKSVSPTNPAFDSSHVMEAFSAGSRASKSSPFTISPSQKRLDEITVFGQNLVALNAYPVFLFTGATIGEENVEIIPPPGGNITKGSLMTEFPTIATDANYFALLNKFAQSEAGASLSGDELKSQKGLQAFRTFLLTELAGGQPQTKPSILRQSVIGEDANYKFLTEDDINAYAVAYKKDRNENAVDNLPAFAAFAALKAIDDPRYKIPAIEGKQGKFKHTQGKYFNYDLLHTPTTEVGATGDADVAFIRILQSEGTSSLGAQVLIADYSQSAEQITGRLRALWRETGLQKFYHQTQLGQASPANIKRSLLTGSLKEFYEAANEQIRRHPKGATTSRVATIIVLEYLASLIMRVVEHAENDSESEIGEIIGDSALSNATIEGLIANSLTSKADPRQSFPSFHRTSLTVDESFFLAQEANGNVVVVPASHDDPNYPQSELSGGRTRYTQVPHDGRDKFSYLAFATSKHHGSGERDDENVGQQQQQKGKKRQSSNNNNNNTEDDQFTYQQQSKKKFSQSKGKHNADVAEQTPTFMINVMQTIESHLVDYDQTRKNLAPVSSSTDRIVLLPTPNMVLRYNREVFETNSNVVRRVAKLLWLFMPINYPQLLTLIQKDLDFPFDFLLERPFRMYDAGTGFMAAGPVGVTLYSRPVIELGDNTVNREHYGVGVVTVAPDLYLPDAYLQMRDLSLHNYLGGEGVKFFSPKLFQAANARENTSSIFCFLVPFGSLRSRGHPSLPKVALTHDFRGRTDGGLSEVKGLKEIILQNGPQQDYIGAFWYNIIYGLLEKLPLASIATLCGEAFILPNIHHNSTTRQEHQQLYDDISGGYNQRIIISTDAFGQNVYTGAKQGRLLKEKIRFMDYTDRSVSI